MAGQQPVRANPGVINPARAGPPPEGMNYMEEQFITYGHDLGNYRPSPIIGTNQMSSVYKSDNLTPEEYNYFFNWRHPLVPGGKKLLKRNRPSGTNILYDQTHLHGQILAEHEKKYEFTRVHGGTVQNRTRYDEAPVFLSSG